MRVMMIGPGRAVAMQRPLAWVLHRGHRVWLVSDRNPRERNEPNFRFVRLWPSRGAGTRPTQITRHGAWSWLRAMQLRLLAAVVRPHIVHAHHLSGPALACARAGLRPLIVSAWGALNRMLTSPADALTRPVRDILRAADALIVESPALAKACERLTNLRFRTALIPLGTDTGVFRPQPESVRMNWRGALNLAEDTQVLLSPRGWDPIYGQHLILQAYAQVYPHLRLPTVLVFLTTPRGRSGQHAEAYLRHVQQQAESLGLTDRLRWLPELRYDMMPSAYTLADVVINYPSQDAFPSTVVEAAACERPIITAALPSYQGTFIESKDFCIQVQPEQPQALAEAIGSVVNAASGARTSHLRQVRQVIVEQYDERLAKTRLFALYRELIAASHAGERCATGS